MTSNSTPPLWSPRIQPQTQVSPLTSPCLGGEAQAYTLCPEDGLRESGSVKLPLSLADGPYLVIVEQPKQVSEQKGWCEMASALGASGVVVAGWPWGQLLDWIVVGC
jgi:hypothetical protein